MENNPKQKYRKKNRHNNDDQARKIAKAVVKEERKEERKEDLRKPKREQPTHPRKLIKQVLDDWEVMLLAKHSPGTINSPFVQAMGVSTINTGIVTSQFSMTTAWSLGSLSQQPLGTNDYTVIFYSPSQSVAYGPGNFYLPETSKRSGFSILQTDTPGASIDPNSIFYDTNFTKSMSGIYGTQGQSISANAFIWASHLDLVLLANQLNASGDYYTGEFPYSSLMDEFGSPGNVTIADLIRMSKPRKIVDTIPLSCSMVNNNLPTNAFVNTTDEVQKGFSSELVSYLVIHKPYTPLDGGANVTFSIDTGVRSNFGAYVRTDDQFSRQILRPPTSGTPVSLQEIPEGDRKGLISARDFDFKNGGIDYGYTTNALAKSELSTKISNLRNRSGQKSNWMLKAWTWLQDFYSEARPVIAAVVDAA